MRIEDRSTAGNRRLFLQQAGALTLGAGAAGLFAVRPAAAAAPKLRSDVGVIQTALALEHEGIAAYRLAGKSGLLSRGTLEVATIFMGHHEAHRNFLRNWSCRRARNRSSRGPTRTMSPTSSSLR